MEEYIHFFILMSCALNFIIAISKKNIHSAAGWFASTLLYARWMDILNIPI